MKVSAQGLKHVRKEEGSRAKMYLDPVGKPTIGVGHLLTQDELSSGKILIDTTWVRWENGLSESDIEKLLDNDLDWAEGAVNDTFRRAFNRYHNDKATQRTLRIEQHQFDMLVSLVFNIGAGAWSNSTLVKRIMAGRIEEVPDQILRWKYSGGKPILEPRRKREVKIYNEGYQ